LKRSSISGIFYFKGPLDEQHFLWGLADDNQL
jgi:hypothetical protein